MLQPSEVDIQIEVAVLKTKIDNIEESVDGIKDHLEGVEQRVMRIERTVYMLLGGLIILQFLPMLGEYISALS